MDENTITTVFKADISQFSSSTQQLNQYIKTVNSEFDVATSSLGKWSDSTDGLKARITQLNKVLEAEKMKLSDMKKRLEEMEKAGKGNTKEAKNLQIAINQQTAKIQKAEKQTDDYTKSLQELEKAGVKTKQELKELTDAQEKQGKSAESVASRIGKGIGGMALGIAGMATAAVGSFMGMAEGTREFRKEQAQLETAFKKAGFSAETMKNHYTEFNAILGDTGKSTEAMQQLADFAKTEEELADYTNILTGVFATYGEALPTESLAEAINHTISLGSQVEGSLADAFEWAGVNVDDFNERLEKCNTEEERSKLISKELNKLYGEQAEHYKENNKDIIEAEKAQTRLTQAMAELGEVAEPIMTMLKNAFAGLMEAIQPFVKLIGEGLQSAFNGSTEGAKKLADGLSGILKTLLDKVNAVIPSVVNIFVELVPSIINTILNALPNLVTTLVNAISTIVGALGEIIPQVIQTIIDTIPQLVQSIMDALPVLLDGISQLIMGIVEALPSLINSLLQALPQIIQTIIDGLNSFIPQLIDAAITLFMAIVDAIPLILQALNDNLPKIITTIIDGLLSMLPQLLQGAIQLLMAIIQAIPTIIQALTKEIPNIVTTIVRVLTSRIGDVINGAIQLLSGILEAIPQIIAELIKQMPSIIKTMVEALIDGIPEMIKAGGDLLSGLFEGLLNPEAIWNAVKSLFNGIVGGIKKVFGIASPSKVFKEQIGKNLALGIGEGFTDEIDDVTKDMQKSLNKMTNDLEVDNSGIVGFNNTSAPSWVEQLFDLIKNQNVTNNYKFDYKFERMETSKLALHKAALETKRAIGG